MKNLLIGLVVLALGGGAAYFFFMQDADAKLVDAAVMETVDAARAGKAEAILARLDPSCSVQMASKTIFTYADFKARGSALLSDAKIDSIEVRTKSLEREGLTAKGTLTLHVKSRAHPMANAPVTYTVRLDLVKTPEGTSKEPTKWLIRGVNVEPSKGVSGK